jgi:hypothetical protein
MQMKLTEKLKLEEEIKLSHGCHCVDTTTRFGDNLSVRKPPDKKPIIGFGQDEAVMKQHCFTTKAWTAPSGQKAITPKDEGMGVHCASCRTPEQQGREDDEGKGQRLAVDAKE